MDPLTASYPWYTPYQFAGNKPIFAIDLDGLEEVNAISSNHTDATLREPVSKQLLKELEYTRLQSLKPYNWNNGFGELQRHQFILLANGTKEQFEKLKSAYVSDPGLIQDNSYANYDPIENPSDCDNNLDVNDGMKIDILGPFNGTVRFTDVQVLENSFYVQADIVIDESFLDANHPDAGWISFSGIYDEESSRINYSIYNETSIGNFTVQIGGGLTESIWTNAPRLIQELQWKKVVSNAQNYMNIQDSEVISRKHNSGDQEGNSNSEEF